MSEAQANGGAADENKDGAAGGAADGAAAEGDANKGADGGSSLMGGTGAKGDEKKPEAKADGDKPYAIEVPKELEEHVDKAGLEKFSAWAKAEGFTLEQANKLAKYDLERRAAAVAAETETVVNQDKAWLAEVTADKDIGGDKMPVTKANMDRAVVKFGPPGMGKRLELLGMGNHPDIVKFTSAVGAALAEDNGQLPGASGGGQQQRRESIYDPLP